MRTQDVREALRFAPYKSVAPEVIGHGPLFFHLLSHLIWSSVQLFFQVLNHKKQTDEFIRKEPDATKITRSSLQNKLHGLELQRLELQKQTDEKKLGTNGFTGSRRKSLSSVTSLQDIWRETSGCVSLVQIALAR